MPADLIQRNANLHHDYRGPGNRATEFPTSPHSTGSTCTQRAGSQLRLTGRLIRIFQAHGSVRLREKLPRRPYQGHGAQAGWAEAEGAA